MTVSSTATATARRSRFASFVCCPGSRMLVIAVALFVTVGLLQGICVIRSISYAPSSSSTRHYNHHNNNETHYTCAPSMVQKRQRKVLFYRAGTMESYYRLGSRGGGENYVYASLSWALEQNGFHVDVIYYRPFSMIPIPELYQYHRIFFNGIKYMPELTHHPDLICRLRLLHFWGNWRDDHDHDHPYQYDPRQILSPYTEDYNTFLGFFVHSHLWQTTASQSSQQHPSSSSSSLLSPQNRTKQGLIVGRKPFLFKDPQSKAIMQALIDDGFTLHSICRGFCGLPRGVVMHTELGPREYADFMDNMAFLIGFGHPVVSPSPLEGLAHGAAFLNPISNNNVGDIQKALLRDDYPLHWYKGHPIQTQHRPLSLLGMPYVYNIDLQNITQILEAANYAVRYRFDSYTPWEYRPEAMVARACSLMEDDALCRCPNTPFATNDTASNGDGHSSSNIDCRGSSYIRNPSR